MRRGIVQGEDTGRRVTAELGPEVADQVRLAQRHPLERPAMEIALPLLLPARPQRLHPFGIGRRVATLVDGRWRALKHVQVLGIPAEVRHELYAGGARADERDALVGELVQSAGGVPAGVVIVPTRRVEAVSFEVLDSRDAGQLRPVERTRPHHDEASANVVVAVGADPPALDLLVPAQIAHLCGEDRRIVEPEVLSDAPAMLIDLGAVGELLARHEVELFEQRYVAV